METILWVIVTGLLTGLYVYVKLRAEKYESKNNISKSLIKLKTLLIKGMIKSIEEDKKEHDKRMHNASVKTYNYKVKYLAYKYALNMAPIDKGEFLKVDSTLRLALQDGVKELEDKIEELKKERKEIY